MCTYACGVSSLPFASQPNATPNHRGVGVWRRAFATMVLVVALLWSIEIVNVATGYWFTHHLGVRPRSLGGLWGILFAPLLHASIGHLVSNTVPLVILGFVGLVGNQGRFLGATAIAWVVSGLGYWLIGGSHTVGVGASGVVYGWCAYLIARGWIAHKLGQALVGVIVLAFYGVHLIWAALPLVSGPIAWQAHLFGAAAGLLSATLLDAGRPERPALPTSPATPTVPPLGGI